MVPDGRPWAPAYTESTDQWYEQGATGRPSVLPDTADCRESASGSRHGFDNVTKSLIAKTLPRANHNKSRA